MWPFTRKSKTKSNLEPARTLPAYQADELARIKQGEKALLEEVISGPGFGDLVSPWMQFFDGLKLMFPLFPVRFDFRYANSYIFLSQNQLDLFRSYSRYLYEVNAYAQGGLNCLADYTIATGFVPYCQARRGQANPALCDLATRYLEDILNANQWWLLERELFIRTKRDGDIFLRFYPQDNGITQLRIIEPEQVRQGPNPFNLPDAATSFGVVTDPDDRLRRLGYLVYWESPSATGQGPDPEFVPASEMVAWINHLDLSNKRGLSDFFVLQDIMDESQKLLRAGRLGEAVRQSIAYIRQWPLANQSTISALQAANTDYQLPKYGLQTPPLLSPGQPESVTQVQPGEVHDVPEQMEMQQPPVGNTQNMQIALNASLRAAAIKWRVPEWILTGDSDANFASALVAESPMCKARTWDQRFFLQNYKKVWHKLLAIGAQQGVLPQDILQRVEACAEPIPVASRNLKEETERNQILYQNGVLSKRTWRAREDLDYDEEEKNLASEPQPVAPPLEKPGKESNTPGAEYQRTVNRPEG